MQKTCRWCGKKFTPKVWFQRFCVSNHRIYFCLKRSKPKKVKVLFKVVVFLTISLTSPIWSYAQETPINPEKLATAIFWAEGGFKTAHQYGILKHYRHTTPRQACLNTIRHAMINYARNEEKKPFLVYLRDIYAPIGCANDPKGLNRNWLSNVERLYHV